MHTDPEYKRADFPLDLRMDLNLYSKGDLGAFFSWFKESMDERVEAFGSFVRKTDGFSSWFPTWSEESMRSLDAWLVIYLNSRNITRLNWTDPFFNFERRKEFEPLFDRDVDIVLFDMGAILGDVVVKNFNLINWTQELGSQSFIDFGWPVLKGLSASRINPIRVAVNAVNSKFLGKSYNGFYNYASTWTRFLIK